MSTFYNSNNKVHTTDYCQSTHTINVFVSQKQIKKEMLCVIVVDKISTIIGFEKENICNDEFKRKMLKPCLKFNSL